MINSINLGGGMSQVRSSLVSKLDIFFTDWSPLVSLRHEIHMIFAF